MKLLILLATLPLIACGGATFEADSAQGDAGASGDDGVAGAMDLGGSSGAGATAGTPSVAGKPAGHAGKGGAGGTAGSAGTAPTAGAPQAGTGGSTTAGSGGSAPVGGSAGSEPTAGAAGAVDVPPDPPSCSPTQAFGKTDAPDAFLLPAWSSTNTSDNVCWQGDDRVCTFTLGEWSLSEDGKARLSVSEITCDKPLYAGTPKSDVCADQVDCEVFKGSVADLAIVEFGLEPEGNGYAASDFHVKAASSSGGLASCDLNASTLTDELRAAVTDMISMVTFSCGAE